MDHLIRTLSGPIHGPFRVPPSKSLHQRALVLAALGEGPEPDLGGPGLRPPGEDVQRLSSALQSMGRWSAGALGTSRASLVLDLGEGGTGFRFCLAAAALRPAGARTLVRGRPSLLRRPHKELLRALERRGARLKRRHSGAVRVLGGGLGGGHSDQALRLDPRRSSQYASALLLTAPRSGGLVLELAGRPSSLPYLRLTLDVLERFGVPTHSRGLETETGRIEVAAAAPRALNFALEPDASAAAAWWAAAALCGGEAAVPTLGRASRQADVALLGILEKMGASVEEAPDGSAVVRSDGERLRAPGELDLQDAPDVLFLVGVLAAGALGETRLRGVAHTRGKESDRVAVLAAGLEALGGRVRIESDDCLVIHGATLSGGRVEVRGDHRVAFAFGVLGLRTPGVLLAGAQAVAKSQPGFLRDLDSLADEGRPAV